MKWEDLIKQEEKDFDEQMIELHLKQINAIVFTGLIGIINLIVNMAILIFK